MIAKDSIYSGASWLFAQLCLGQGSGCMIMLVCVTELQPRVGVCVNYTGVLLSPHTARLRSASACQGRVHLRGRDVTRGIITPEARPQVAGWTGA